MHSKMQATSQLLMIRPVCFGYNEETAVNNSFQVKNFDSKEVLVSQKAQNEFDRFVDVLSSHEISVLIINDTPQPFTPDSIFPNNWISFHDGQSICLFPMFAKNRRLERKPHITETILSKFELEYQLDLTYYEESSEFLEGTGSMVIDRTNRVAYACLSPRTHLKVFDDFCQRMNYRPVSFHAYDAKGDAIYHTNVMMCVADTYAVICLESITDSAERQAVKEILEQSGKAVIEITTTQMNHFAGNMLQVCNRQGKKFLIMSTQAYNSLNREQIEFLEGYNDILHSSLETIETNGGGSARCMMAEIFLKPRVVG